MEQACPGQVTEQGLLYGRAQTGPAGLTTVLWADVHFERNQVEPEPSCGDNPAITPSMSQERKYIFASAGSNGAVETKHCGESDIMAF